jgi:hypothetical protein
MSRTTISSQLEEAKIALKAQLAAMETLQQEVYVLRVSAAAHQEQLQAIRLSAVADAKAAHAVDVAELEKKLKSKESSYDYQGSRLTLAEHEIEQAHAVLDGVDGAPERTYTKADGYNTMLQRNVVTRLAGAFLAIARNSGSLAK